MPELPSKFDPSCPRVTTDAVAYEMSEERLEEIRTIDLAAHPKGPTLLSECIEEIDRLREELEKAEESQERTREGYIQFRTAFYAAHECQDDCLEGCCYL